MARIIDRSGGIWSEFSRSTAFCTISLRVAVTGMVAMLLSAATTWYHLQPVAFAEITSTDAMDVLAADPVVWQEHYEVGTAGSFRVVGPSANTVASWAPWTAALYVSGVALMLLRLACSAWGVRRIRRLATPVSTVSADRLERLTRQLRLRARPHAEDL